ncbi:MAG: hypothetical protein ACKOE2_13995 [Actinomycetales bacterium]|jgi:hypothetical protein
MTYTQLAIASVVVVVIADLWLLRTRMVTRKVFWTSYAIVVFFQLVSNGMFTGFGIVKYDGDAIIGETSPLQGPPPFIGAGRIAFAPIEDLLFGFSLILLSIAGWIWLGRAGLQRTPTAGPPIWRAGPRGSRGPRGMDSSDRSGGADES